MLTVKITIPPLEEFTITPSELERVGMDVVNKTLDVVEKDYQSIVATFSHKPKFTRRNAKNDGWIIRGSYGTTDGNFVRLNEGTPPRVIRARRKKVMKFRPGYRPKTSPGVIGSRGSSRFGPTLYRSVVGRKRPHRIRPRKFDETVARHARIVLAYLTSEAMAR